MPTKKPAEPTEPVRDITRDWVRDFLAALASQTTAVQTPDGEVEWPKYATGTVLTVRTTLSSIMSEAVERGYAQTNPCHKLRGLPKDEPRKTLFLTRQRYTRWQAQCPASRTAP